MANKQEAEQALITPSWVQRVVKQSKQDGTVKRAKQDEEVLIALAESDAWKMCNDFWDKKLKGLKTSLSESITMPGITAEEIGMRYLIVDQIEDVYSKFRRYVERPAKAKIVTKLTGK